MNDGMPESWLLFRKRKKPVYINLPVLKEGNWFFEVLRTQRKKNKWKWVNQIQKLSMYPRAQEQSVTFKVKLIKAAPEIEFDDMITHVH